LPAVPAVEGHPAPAAAETRPEATAATPQREIAATEARSEAAVETQQEPALAGSSRAVVVEIPDDDSPPLGWDHVGGNRVRRVDADTTAPWSLSLPSATTARLLLQLGRGKENAEILNYTGKEIRKRLVNRRPKDRQTPSVLSSHYSVSVSLQGVHYL
jgi:hypothetical protein